MQNPPPSEKTAEVDILASILENHVEPSPNQKRTLEFHRQNLDAISWYPASRDKHHCYPGGYYDHVGEVMNNVMTLFHLCVLPTEKFTMSDILLVAYWHDIDKACSLEPGKSFRYEVDAEPPTVKQRDYAHVLGVFTDEYESKTSISFKIDEAIAGRLHVDERRIPRFKYRERESIDDAAIVVAIAAQAGVTFSIEQLSALSTHHGGWSPLVKSDPVHNFPNPLGVLLHCADLISSSCQRGL
jgi:hypothetical protein